MTPIQYPRVFACSLLLAGLSATGCNGDDPASDDGSADTDAAESGSGASDDGGSSGEAEPMLFGSMTDFLDGMPVAGATVCVRDQPDIECVTTDDEGAWAFEGLAPETAVLDVDHDNYPHYLMYVPYSGVDLGWGVLMVSRDTAALLVQTAGGTLDPALGAITATAGGGTTGEGQAGIVATISPDDAGVGPIYLNDAGLPDPNATETSALGQFGWANIPVGPHTFTLTHPNLACTSPLDLDGAGTDVQIEADTITVAPGHTCL